MNSVDQLKWAAIQVERDQKIVGEIYDRWPNLRVRFLDPDKASDITDHPFTLWELCPDGQERIVFGFDRIGPELIDQIHSMNQATVDLDEVVRQAEAKFEKESAAKEAEQDGQDRDLIAVGIKHFNSGKLKYKFTNEHGEKRTIQ